MGKAKRGMPEGNFHHGAETVGLEELLAGPVRAPELNAHGDR